MLRKLCLFALVAFIFVTVGSLAFAQDEEFVFGVVLVGPQNDRGWSQSHYEGGLYVEEHIPGTRMVVFESLNTADAPETTLLDVVTEMVDQGAKIIFTTSDEFEDDTDVVALNFPDVAFVNTTGDTVLEGTAPQNVGDYNSQFETARMVSACAAALVTQTGKIGYLGALINQETRRHAASAYLAARHCYQTYAGGNADELEFTVTWIGFWFNIPGVTLDPTEVSNTFFDSGADVVMSGIDTTEALVVAGGRQAEGEKVWAVPTDNAAGCEEAPDACVGAPYENWGPPYVRYVQTVMDGTWESGWEWESPDYADFNNPDTSAIGFAYGSVLTQEQIGQIESFIAEMGAFADANPGGYIYLWEGPLNLQDGTVYAQDGELVEPLDIWRLPQLLEGMIGASE